MRTPILIALLTLTAVPATGADFSVIRDTLKKSLPDMEISDIRPSPYAGLFEVVADRKNIFYVDEKAEFAFMGNIFNIAKKQNLTQERLGEINKVDFAALPIDLSIVKVKGNGSRKIALFSDPDCPFCKELEKSMENISDVTIYTFLYPLTAIHPDARRKAEQIWCASDRAKTWDEWMLNGKTLPGDAAKCSAPIGAIEALGQKLGIAGTPGIIFGNGRRIEGAIPQQQIEALLNAK
jgi:thiol:disulfide interchange protein DsbC